ncbi:MAG: uL22 family ribosomal protein [Candidatus Micrarchaeaceae archaeon]
MRYSYNLDRKDITFAHGKDINASFKDLAIVCDAIRYRNVGAAIAILDGVINDGKAMEYRKYNKYMGSRTELGGRKGRYPMKCSAIVKKVIINAMANAKNKGQFDPEAMVIVHAAANKTLVASRTPPKGVRAVATGGSGGYTTMRRSDLELAKVEIGICAPEKKELGNRMKRVIAKIGKTPVKVIVTKKDAKAQKKPITIKPQRQSGVAELAKKNTETAKKITETAGKVIEDVKSAVQIENK